METSTIIKGGLGVIATYGVCRAIKYLTTPIPITAEEMAKKPFDPATSGWDHPFFDEWGSIERNMETLENLERIFIKYLKRNLNGRTSVDELDVDEKNLLYMASISKTFSDAIMRHPEAILESIEEECDFDLEGDGTVIWDPTADPSTESDKDKKEKAKARQNSHRRNAKNVRKLSRKLACIVMDSIMFNSILAEPITKVIKGTACVDDLSSEMIKTMFNVAFSMLPPQFKNTVEGTSARVFSTL